MKGKRILKACNIAVCALLWMFVVCCDGTSEEHPEEDGDEEGVELAEDSVAAAEEEWGDGEDDEEEYEEYDDEEEEEEEPEEVEEAPKPKEHKAELPKPKVVQENVSVQDNRYTWLNDYTEKNILINRIPVPEGYVRVEVEKNSFGDWLRHIPLKPGYPKVKLYNGALKANQSAQFAVINIDVGSEDLQQCADAIMRLKAEYHFSRQEPDNIHFNFTSGDNAEYSKWIEGYRPVITGNKVSWVKKASPDDSYKGFKSYMRLVFMYAGTSSLSQEMQTRKLAQMKPGDVFIKGGFPGHAVIVMDMAVHPSTGKKVFLLAQSYMPAQDVHILNNPEYQEGYPWYSLEFAGNLQTPEWTFKPTDLKYFK